MSTSGVYRLDIILTSYLEQYRFHLFVFFFFFLFYEFSIINDKTTSITSVLWNFQAEIAMRKEGNPGMSDEEVR